MLAALARPWERCGATAAARSRPPAPASPSSPTASATSRESVDPSASLRHLVAVGSPACGAALALTAGAELPLEAIAAALDMRRPSLFLLGGLLDAWPRALHAEALRSVAGLAGSGSRLLAPLRGGPLASAEAKEALERAGWTRVDVVGQAALSRLLPRSPPDAAAQLLVAELGAASTPGRPPPTRTGPVGGGGGPVEASF
mmetsp:Transcript_83816/g.203298  ORF Transcript_83816/g.203298 Transcript_83816/m.203298 type:complete len:201 (-) Transcript_83816:13-615(-)